jgi:hypothetical protein
MRASTITDQDTASSTSPKGAVETGSTSPAFKPSRSSTDEFTRTAVRPSSVAQPSKTASAKAIPRRIAVGDGSSCRAAAKPARNSTTATADPTSPTPRTSTRVRSLIAASALWQHRYSANARYGKGATAPERSDFGAGVRSRSVGEHREVIDSDRGGPLIDPAIAFEHFRAECG